jgi:hypothetical protein
VAALVALAAGYGISRIDVRPDSRLGWLAFQGTADDARALLITISSTVVTLIALVLGLTVVALQLSSTQFSPRLLGNFMVVYFADHLAHSIQIDAINQSRAQRSPRDCPRGHGECLRRRSTCSGMGGAVARSGVRLHPDCLPSAPAPPGERSVEALADAERSIPREPSLERVRAAVSALRRKINSRRSSAVAGT